MDVLHDKDRSATDTVQKDSAYDIGNPWVWSSSFDRERVLTEKDLSFLKLLQMS